MKCRCRRWPDVDKAPNPQTLIETKLWTVPRTTVCCITKLKVINIVLFLIDCCVFIDWCVNWYRYPEKFKG